MNTGLLSCRCGLPLLGQKLVDGKWYLRCRLCNFPISVKYVEQLRDDATSSVEDKRRLQNAISDREAWHRIADERSARIVELEGEQFQAQEAIKEWVGEFLDSVNEAVRKAKRRKKK